MDVPAFAVSAAQLLSAAGALAALNAPHRRLAPSAALRRRRARLLCCFVWLSNACLILDVVFSALYPALFGTAHLGSLLGLVGTITYVAIGASPIVFGLAASLADGSFVPVLMPLACWMPISAAAVAFAPPLRSRTAESLGAPPAPAESDDP